MTTKNYIGNKKASVPSAVQQNVADAINVFAWITTIKLERFVVYCVTTVIEVLDCLKKRFSKRFSIFERIVNERTNPAPLYESMGITAG